MEINGIYWVPVSHNGRAPEFFTSTLLHIPIPFVATTTSTLVASSNHPNQAFSVLSCINHIISLDSKGIEIN